MTTWSPDMMQLRMSHARLDAVPPPARPPDYAIRRFRPGDEAAWIALLNTGDFGVWDHGRLEPMLAGERAPLPLAGIYFAMYGSRPVGTACTFRHQSNEGGVSELGWVAVHPLHRGRHL